MESRFSEANLWTEIISGILVIISQIAVCTSVYRPWAQLPRGRQKGRPNIGLHFHLTRECSVQRNCREQECVTVPCTNLRTIDITTLIIGLSPS